MIPALAFALNLGAALFAIALGYVTLLSGWALGQELEPHTHAWMVRQELFGEMSRIKGANDLVRRENDSLFFRSSSGDEIELKNSHSFNEEGCGSLIDDCKLYLFLRYDTESGVHIVLVLPTVDGTDAFSHIAVDPRTKSTFDIGHGKTYASPGMEFILVIDEGFMGYPANLKLFRRDGSALKSILSHVYEQYEFSHHQLTHFTDRGEFGARIRFFDYSISPSEERVKDFVAARRENSWTLRIVEPAAK